MNPWLYSLLIMLACAVAIVLVWAILELLKKVIFRAMDKADDEEAAAFDAWLAERAKRRAAQRDEADGGLATSD